MKNLQEGRVVEGIRGACKNILASDQKTGYAEKENEMVKISGDSHRAHD